MSKRIGVVLVFAEGVDRVLAQAAVDKLAREKLVDAMLSTGVVSFDLKDGSPVWYVP